MRDLVAFIKVPAVFEQALSLISSLGAVDASFTGWALSTAVVKNKKNEKKTNLKNRDVKFFILVTL